MEKEICITKEKLEKLIDEENQKLVLVKKFVKRKEFIFKIGEEQFSESETIYEDENYALLAQNIDDKLKDKILNLINK